MNAAPKASPVVTVGTAAGGGAVLDVTGVTGGANFNATTSSFALASGQKLQGFGTVNGSAAVAAGTTLAPGTSIGTLAVTNGTLSWLPGGTLAYEHDVNTTSPAPTTAADFIDGSASGVLNLANLGTGAAQQFNLQLLPVFNGTGSTTPVQYTIGTFTGITLPAGVTGPDVTSLFAVSGAFRSTPVVSTNGTSLFVTFTPVPEPGLVLLACGIAAGGWTWRRRK